MDSKCIVIPWCEREAYEDDIKDRGRLQRHYSTQNRYQDGILGITSRDHKLPDTLSSYKLSFGALRERINSAMVDASCSDKE